MEKLVSINCSQKFDLWRSKIAEAPLHVFIVHVVKSHAFFLAVWSVDAAKIYSGVLNTDLPP